MADRVRRGRKVRGDLWFSIAKGGDKTLDHIGKRSESKHRTVNLKDVLEFVKWDVFHNTEFVFGSVVLAQGDKGVPVGGFLAAQLCVCCGGSSVSCSFLMMRWKKNDGVIRSRFRKLSMLLKRTRAPHSPHYVLHVEVF